MPIGTNQTSRDTQDQGPRARKGPDTRNTPANISPKKLKEELSTEIAQALARMNHWVNEFQALDWNVEAKHHDCSMVMTGTFVLGRVNATTADKEKRDNGIRAIKRHEAQLKTMGFITTLKAGESEFILTAVHQASRDATNEDIMVPHPLNPKMGWVKFSEAVKIEADSRAVAVQRDEEKREEQNRAQEAADAKARGDAEAARVKKDEDDWLAQKAAEKAEADRVEKEAADKAAADAANQTGNNTGS
ncbi:hypothetical protein LCGC14_0450920 [marine sediment metagenome]|uniref:Uncharacterized protein n=1 Tax=marine sediment metagenome TaxID=412755 RepID=A0A0F9V4K5_9ZZZZ